MTDSMKFGPEWLRNMSADSTNPGFSSGGNSSATYNPVSSNSLTGSTSGSGGVIGLGGQQNSSTSHLPAPRNLFPEFRYGREEMLSLFDKNCGIPEILPSYKKIFVEKVQYPLALTPSTDEEMTTQGPTVATQRPPWMQRSPVGFNSAIRGVGRGGSVDRGRMRGKSMYHPIYQRPAAMFEDDPRSASSKSDRNWSERNGVGDSLSTEWSSTPTSSPRKEFSSHSRNLENWRRNRNDDGSGDTSSGSITSSDGWRGSSISTFGNAHRWGRSTSWRDEEMSSGNIDNSFGVGIMQRSFSTISTTITDRASGGNQPNRGLNSLTGTNNSIQTTRGNQSSWSTCGAIMVGIDGEDNLPEWAIENPSDSGGTFDASGAFHGSPEEDDSNLDEKNNDSDPLEKQMLNQRKSSDNSNEDITRTDTKGIVVIEEENRNIGDNTSPTGKITSNSLKRQTERLKSVSQVESREKEKMGEEPSVTAKLIADICSSSKGKRVNNDSSISNLETPTNINTVEPKAALFDSNANIPNNIAGNHSQGTVMLKSILSDFSDRMKEVADDMVEKLIMEDDNVVATEKKGVQGVSKIGGGTPINVGATQNTFVSPNIAVLMKQTAQQQTSTVTAVPQNSATSVSPTLPVPLNSTVNHKTLPLYGGGVVIDHATMAQHHHLQQQQLAAAAAAAGLSSHAAVTLNSTSSSDLWYYRDPQSKVQGPFSAIEMTEWYRAGYFDENLYVRRVCDTRFRPLGELIKLCHGNMPFTHSHLIPMGFDNLQGGNNIGLKTQSENRDEHKGNVIATADSLSAAVKNLISPSDISHMLQMQLQIKQDQYIQHQEVMILTELMKHEWFQHLTPPEREAIVRQKVQLLVLPEYLTSLTGLSNSLATLNPPATSNLYDTIANCSKRDNPYSSNTNPQQQQVPQSTTNTVTTFLDPENYILGNQQQHFDNAPYGSVLGATNNSNDLSSSNGKPIRNDDLATDNALFNNFNLRMFLHGGPAVSQQTSQQPNQKPNVADFVNGTPNTVGDFLTEPQLLTNATVPTVSNQNPIMQMWVPNQPTQIIRQQTQQQSQSHNNQWTGSPLVGIPSVVMEPGLNPNNTTKLLPPTAMWGVSSLEQTLQQVQQVDHISSNSDFRDQILEKTTDEQSTITSQQIICKNKENGIEIAKNDSNILSGNISSHQESLPNSSSKQRKDDVSEKQQNVNKRNCQNNKQSLTTKLKDDNHASNCNSNQKNQDDRRRELAEEKRRQKEERKRQQLEDEERRLQQIEEEKRRQMLEEKERMQQIQAQRRKAMLGNNSGNGTNNGSITSSTIMTASSPGSTNNIKVNKEQRIMKSSVAPWSSQTNAATVKNGPCLAEIQKAERRERRADQQRQMELMMRANAAAATELSDAMLTWNSSPIPVKSFAEIQAEEVKRLASEQLEIQRRKESEQSSINAASLSNSNAGIGINTITGGASGNNLNMATNNISTIWGGGGKVWGATSTAGFWEEPIKFSAAVVGNTSNSSSTTASFSGGLNNTKSNQQQQQKQQLPLVSNQQVNSTRNLRKSQTVSVMQNATANTVAKNVKNQQQQQSQTISKQGNNNNKLQQQKSDDLRKNNKGNSGSAVSGNANTITNSSNAKQDSFENEFNNWCIKSLNNMNTKVDVPTFVTFLQDLESPYEVKDYIRMYLGESKEYTEFAKQFLERRSKYKNLQRAQNAHNDDMCKPAPAITPSNDNSDNKGKQKKCKKNKMTKLDARILGFSVTAAEGRINVGDRDYVDAP